MIKHIVAWTFSDGIESEGATVTKSDAVRRVIELLSACADLPGVTAFKLTRPQEGLEASFDLLLESEFTDVDALRAYASHPLQDVYKRQVRCTRSAAPDPPGCARSRRSSTSALVPRRMLRTGRSPRRSPAAGATAGAARAG